MKTKLYLAALALPLVFGACTNDELLSTNNAVQQNGDLVEVGPDFVISATKGEAAGATRAAWEKNEENQLLYLWKPVADDIQARLDEIGLCWVGKSVADVVYTNYEFVHNGWLKKDEQKAIVDPCEGYVENGYNFYETSFAEGKLNNKDTGEPDILDINSEAGAQYVTIGNLTNPEPTNTAHNKSGSYNMRSAFFKTSAQTLFGGDYIAYFPFNADLKDEGCIPATSPVAFNVNVGEEFAHLSAEKAMFAYGYAPGLVGGTTANDFSFYNLSGLIRVRLSGVGAAKATGVALVDTEGKFISKVSLSAQKIIANQANPTAGKAIYKSGTEEYTNMLSATINGTISGKADIWFSALPTTTGALKVVVYTGNTEIPREDGTEEPVSRAAANEPQSAVYNAPAITVVPGGVVAVNVEVAEGDFNKNIAINEASLRVMVENGKTPITLLGDIRLSEAWTLDESVTIEGGRIIIPAAKRGSEQISLTVVGDKANIKSDILIEGQGCCGEAPGKLEVGNADADATEVKTFAFEGTIDNYGEIVFAAGNGVNTKNVTNVEGNLNNHSQYIKENDDTQYGKITLNKLAVVNLSSTLQNDGEVKIEGVGQPNQDGTLIVAGSVNNAYQMVNAGNINNSGKVANTGTGLYIDKIGSQFGGTQFKNALGGQYICEVNGQNRLDLALNESRRPTTRVRFVGNEALTGDKKFILKKNCKNVDFEVLSPSTTIILAAAQDIEIKDLIVTEGNFRIERFVSQDKKTTYTFKTNSILVDGAKTVNIFGNMYVKNDVVLKEVIGENSSVNIGGEKDKTTNVYAETKMDVDGNFIVGDATPKSDKKAVVAFKNNNTTNIKGTFDLNKTGKCTIEYATTESEDNYAAEVWCGTLNQNGGTWGNTSWVRVRPAAE